jgi:hypothetical protein
VQGGSDFRPALFLFALYAFISFANRNEFRNKRTAGIVANDGLVA